MTTMRTRPDAGFTLIEAVVATFVVILLFTGFGRAMDAAFDGSAENAAAQEATAIAVEQMEFVRSLTWPEIAMTGVPTDMPMVNRQTMQLLAAEADLDEDESLVTGEGALVAPFAVETVDHTTYSVWSYVSAAGGLRRLVVLVTWEVDGVVTTYRTSTLISEVSTR